MNIFLRFKHIIGIAFILVIVLAGYLYVQKNWPVRVVKFKGSYEHIRESDIKKHLAPLIPHSMFSVNLDLFRESVKELPWIKSATIRRLWPDTLLIYFDEYKPFATWCKQGVVTQEGKFIKAGTHDSIYESLSAELCGPEGTEQAVLNQYKRFKKVLDGAGLEIYRVDLSDRYAWELYLSQYLLLKLGRENIDDRLKNFVEHWGTLKKAIHTAAIVDLRYPNGIAVRTEQETAFHGRDL